jgi:hypothetical protein
LREKKDYSRNRTLSGGLEAIINFKLFKGFFIALFVMLVKLPFVKIGYDIHYELMMD